MLFILAYYPCGAFRLQGVSNRCSMLCNEPLLGKYVLSLKILSGVGLNALCMSLAIANKLLLFSLNWPTPQM